MARSVVVVGASLAGLRAAETARMVGDDVRITLIGDEPVLPYDRPPLSKEVLAGAWEPDRTTLRPRDELEGLGIELRLGVPATGLDVDARTVSLGDGSTVSGDAVVVATGAAPRTLPGTPDLDGIFTLRTRDDSVAIEARLRHEPRVVVVGAGFIGSEVAATARGRGLDVTVVEAAPVPLEHALGAEMGGALSRLHRDHGVDLRTGVAVAGFAGSQRLEGVELADGSTIPADLVVVGVGVRPNTEWLESSDLSLDDGVRCDERCVAAPGVYAAGDVCRWPNRRFDEVMRVEHWTNAAEQGMYVGRAAAGGGESEPFAPVPFFWSDQYDAKIQFAGHARRDDTVEVVEGDPGEHRFVATYRRDGRLVGVLGVSMPREVMQYRRRIAEETG